MTAMSELIQGFEILKKHKGFGPDGDDLDVAGEHDAILVSVNNSSLPPESEDGKALEALGWHYDEGFACWARLT